MTSTSAKDASDAKRWLIIGAHQAGASEKRVARISGLSKTAVRHIILNYQRTGNPCLPKREPKKVKEKLLVEYDENGNLIISDDEDEAPIPSKKENGIKKAQTNDKKRSKKLNSKVTAKDLIEYMMEQVKRVENEHTPIPNSTSTTTNNNEYHDEQYYDEYPQQQQQQQQSQYHHRSTWCPTPPRDGSISSNSGGPSDSDSPILNGNNKKTNNNHLPLPDSPSFLPLSPPASGTSSKSSTTTMDTHDPPHPHDPSQHSSTTLPPLYSPSKYDQTIRGYELWTNKDDILLLQHVLTRLQLGNWRELEAKFEGRHTARLCMDRWNYLRNHLLKGIAKADSSPW